MGHAALQYHFEVWVYGLTSPMVFRVFRTVSQLAFSWRSFVALQPYSPTLHSSEERKSHNDHEEKVVNSLQTLHFFSISQSGINHKRIEVIVG